jgi:hypothetical protein
MLLNFAKHTLGVGQDLSVFEAEDAKTLADHVGVSPLIVMPRLICLMNLPVTFNDQVSFTAEEVCDVISKLMLATKFETK